MTAEVAPGEPKPFLVIRPPRRWAPFNLRELWQFRDLLSRFARRDLTLRYRQTALGVIWVIAQPLLAAGAFAFVFGSVAGLSSGGVPYFAFAFAGMLAWNVFSGVLTRMSSSLVGNAAAGLEDLLPPPRAPALGRRFRARRLPREHGHDGGDLVRRRCDARLGLVTLPIWLAAVLLLGSGVGLFAAALMVPYRDVQYVLPVATQLLLFVSPVAYSLASVPKSAQWLYELNPLTGLLEGFRWALLDIGPLNTFATIWAFVCSIAFFIIGAFAFAHMERRFADVI